MTDDTHTRTQALASRPSTFLLVLGALCTGCSNVTQNPLTTLEQIAPSAFYRRANLSISGYTPQSGNVFRNIFVANTTYRLERGIPLEDSDRDGISNLSEGGSSLGIDIRRADTNSDGYGDLTVFLLGMPLRTQLSLPACTEPEVDQDADGLNACEEALLRTSHSKADSDGDGVPDGLELRFGLNPIDGTDSVQDPDGDGIANLEEVRRNTPPYHFNDENIQPFEYRYAVKPVELDGVAAVDFEISNILMLDVPNGNFLRVYILESNGAGVDLLRRGQLLLAPDLENGTTVKTTFEDLAR